MYKVFVNESLVVFSDSHTGNNKLGTLMAKPEDTERIIRNLLSGIFSETDYLIPLSDTETQNILSEKFETVTAAGGLVLDKNNDLLWIFRRGKWDLPKGKADDGETPEQTALREVQEECGIKDLQIDRFLGKAFHIYPISCGKKAVFKTTHWYLMRTRDEEFSPQIEEEITEIKFFGKDNKTPLQNTFRSIKEFLEEHYLAKK